jgi:hypothetical protein
MLEISTPHFRAAELIENRNPAHAAICRRVIRPVRVCLRQSNLNRSTTFTFNTLANFAKPSLTPRLDQADEFHGALKRFGKLDCVSCRVLRSSAMRHPKFLLKHRVQIQKRRNEATRSNYGLEEPNKASAGLSLAFRQKTNKNYTPVFTHESHSDNAERTADGRNAVGHPRPS